MAQDQDTRSEFVVKFEDTLKRDATCEALKLFKDSANSAEIKSNSWEIIPVIASFLTGYNEEYKSEVFLCCKQLINELVNVTNPEEALLQFIEELEECKDDIKFLTLLKPLQTIIVRIPKRRSTSLAWAFNSVQKYLNRCEIPPNKKVVGKEKLLLDAQESVTRILTLYKEILQFYKNLVTQLPVLQEQSLEQQIICKFLVDLLGVPLVYLDMEVFNNVKSKARLFGEEIVLNILENNADPLSLLQLDKEMKNGDLITPKTLSIASLFYLIYHEQVLIDKVPNIYNPTYFFHNSLPLVNSLFDTDQYVAIEKGLKLAESILEHVKHLNLSYMLLDSENHVDFCKELAKIIVFNELEAFRQKALQIYKKYLYSFETKGFYLLVFNLMSTLKHAGLIGYTITLYKDKLVTEINTNKEHLSQYYRGTKLLELLKKFCFLHKAEQSDLIEISDQIISALNLLRFLTIRDKDNITGIWDHIETLENTYFKHLRNGIDISRAHYELKIRETKEEKPGKKDPDAEVSVVVGGQNLHAMTKREKLNFLNSSLTVFDILESLLVRLLECIEHKM